MYDCLCKNVSRSDRPGSQDPGIRVHTGSAGNGRVFRPEMPKGVRFHDQSIDVKPSYWREGKRRVECNVYGIYVSSRLRTGKCTSEMVARETSSNPSRRIGIESPRLRYHQFDAVGPISRISNSDREASSRNRPKRGSRAIGETCSPGRRTNSK
jgi:hypothetical protein